MPVPNLMPLAAAYAAHARKQTLPPPAQPPLPALPPPHEHAHPIEDKKPPILDLVPQPPPPVTTPPARPPMAMPDQMAQVN